MFVFVAIHNILLDSFKIKYVFLFYIFIRKIITSFLSSYLWFTHHHDIKQLIFNSFCLKILFA